MVVYTISFFGHRQLKCLNSVEKCLEGLIKQLLQEHEYVEFLVGRNGAFDQAVSSAIRRVKHIAQEDNSTHILVLPYETARFVIIEKLSWHIMMKLKCVRPELKRITRVQYKFETNKW